MIFWDLNAQPFARHDNRIPPSPTAVALGKFDGVHNGHRALLRATVQTAAQNGLVPAVFTFTAHPAALPMLSDVEEQLAIFRACGIQYVFQYDFQTVQRMTPGEFVQEILCETLHAVYALCGENFHFGVGASGDADDLRREMELCGGSGSVIPSVKYGDSVVCSTLIRSLLTRGDIITANRLLGQPYSFSGAVVHGNRIGHQIQIPTINLQPGADKLIPLNGVYISKTALNGSIYPSITNIGVRPTVASQSSGVVVETHLILDRPFTDEYGTQARVQLLKHLRTERKFSDLAQLQHQINTDITAAKKWFEEEKQNET